MLTKRIFYSFLIVSLICTGLLVTNKWHYTYQLTTDHIIFKDINLPNSKEQQHFKIAINRIIGIKQYKYNSNQHSASINFDHHTMKPEWIEKSLKASGIQTSGYQFSNK
ncbi:hypothetical protein [Terrilactibacillus laevilacticus]|uniref:hypothetical protein n=1 Tax=Terrilactibacillus laevilacticus TaxID=1380157 RepID=UPI0011471B45|nr:hypothetical protein [Terrilactibacillus laevilacticus]